MDELAGTTEMTNDLIVVMCPPFPEHAEAPKDHSASELRDCPHCDSKMWLSEKKKGILLFASCLKKEIFLGCYPCVKEHVKENSDKSTEFNAIKI